MVIQPIRRRASRVPPAALLRYPGASHVLDFAASYYRTPQRVVSDLDSVFPGTFSRTGAGTAERVDGSIAAFATGVPRITDRGLLLEMQRTNLFLNSTAPATQTISLPATGNYTITVWGTGSVAVAAGTATITGAGTATAGAPVTINCSAIGTVTATVSGSLVGVNVEQGGTGTSLIVTGGATATRGFDSATLTGLSIPAPYTLLAVATINRATIGDLVTTNTQTDGAGFFTDPGTRAFIREANAETGNSRIGTSVTVGQTVRLGARFATNDLRSATNGTLAPVDATCTPQTITSLGLGRSLYPIAGIHDIYLRRVLIYPRAFSDTELQALTA